MKKVFVSLTVLALMLSATSALAYYGGHGHGGSDITVTNNKNAVVDNLVVVEANTGWNFSNGGSGGNGGSGDGASSNTNHGGTQTNTGGSGGDGGKGGNGGTITTGNATAKAKVKNKVNTDITKINLCECNGGSDVDDITVNNNDHATVGNGVMVFADTGLNDTNGGEGDDGGSGGGANNNDNGYWWNGGGTQTNTGGDGGNGDNGGSGGTIRTGSADSKAKVVNVVNTIVTRITR